MAKKKTNSFEDIILASIDIISQEIINDVKYPIVSSDVLAFDFDSQIHKELDEKEDWANIKIEMSIKPKLAKDKRTRAEAKFTIEYLFIVPNLKQFLSIDTRGTISMNADLDQWLMQCTASTSRGLVFEKVNGTFLEGIILPLLLPI